MNGLNIGVAIGLTLSGVLGLAYMYYVKGRAERRKIERDAMRQMTKSLEKKVEDRRDEFTKALDDYRNADHSDDSSPRD